MSQARVLDAVAVAVCRGCGCTDERGCEEGCSWAEPDLCSSCKRAGQDEHTPRRMYQLRPMGERTFLVCRTLIEAFEILAQCLEMCDAGEMHVIEPIAMSRREHQQLGEFGGW